MFKRALYLHSFPDILQINGRDTVILDRAEIKKFCNLLNSLEHEEKGMYYDYNSYTYPDFRCGVILKMKSGAEWCYCFGESQWIFYNGCSFMKDYQPIFDYINKSIYDTKPQKYWYGDKRLAVEEFIERDQQQLDSLEAAQQAYWEGN